MSTPKKKTPNAAVEGAFLLRVPYERLRASFNVMQNHFTMTQTEGLPDSLESQLQFQSQLLTQLDLRLQALREAQERGEERAPEQSKKGESGLPRESSFLQRTRVDRMLHSFCSWHGWTETAATLARVQHLPEAFLDTSIYDALEKLQRDIRVGDWTSVLQWLTQHASRLESLSSRTQGPLSLLLELELTFHVEMYLDFIRQDDLTSARDYAQRYVGPSFQRALTQVEKSGDSLPALVHQTQQALTLLAFPNRASISIYHELWQKSIEKRLPALLSLIQYAFLQVYDIGPILPFDFYLQSGLVGLKTPMCGQLRSGACPVCRDSGQILSEHLPCADPPAQSRFKCAFSGEVMNEFNPPMCLPNGYVYGKNTIDQLCQASKDTPGDSLTCPRTQQVFTRDQVRSVYIL